MLLRSERKSVRNSPVDPSEDWGGDALRARTDPGHNLVEQVVGSLQPFERNIPECISTLQTTECHVKTAIHTAALGGSHAREDDRL